MTKQKIHQIHLSWCFHQHSMRKSNNCVVLELNYICDLIRMRLLKKNACRYKRGRDNLVPIHKDKSLLICMLFYKKIAYIKHEAELKPKTENILRNTDWLIFKNKHERAVFTRYFFVLHYKTGNKLIPWDNSLCTICSNKSSCKLMKSIETF